MSDNPPFIKDFLSKLQKLELQQLDVLFALDEKSFADQDGQLVDTVFDVVVIGYCPFNTRHLRCQVVAVATKDDVDLEYSSIYNYFAHFIRKSSNPPPHILGYYDYCRHANCFVYITQRYEFTLKRYIMEKMPWSLTSYRSIAAQLLQSCLDMQIRGLSLHQLTNLEDFVVSYDPHHNTWVLKAHAFLCEQMLGQANEAQETMKAAWLLREVFDPDSGYDFPGFNASGYLAVREVPISFGVWFAPLIAALGNWERDQQISIATALSHPVFTLVQGQWSDHLDQVFEIFHQAAAATAQRTAKQQALYPPSLTRPLHIGHHSAAVSRQYIPPVASTAVTTSPLAAPQGVAAAPRSATASATITPPSPAPIPSRMSEFGTSPPVEPWNSNSNPSTLAPTALSEISQSSAASPPYKTSKEPIQAVDMKRKALREAKEKVKQKLNSPTSPVPLVASTGPRPDNRPITNSDKPRTVSSTDVQTEFRGSPPRTSLAQWLRHQKGAPTNPATPYRGEPVPATNTASASAAQPTSLRDTPARPVTPAPPNPSPAVAAPASNATSSQQPPHLRETPPRPSTPALPNAASAVAAPASNEDQPPATPPSPDAPNEDQPEHVTSVSPSSGFSASRQLTAPPFNPPPPHWPQESAENAESEKAPELPWASQAAEFATLVTDRNSPFGSPARKKKVTGALISKKSSKRTIQTNRHSKQRSLSESAKVEVQSSLARKEDHGGGRSTDSSDASASSQSNAPFGDPAPSTSVSERSPLSPEQKQKKHKKNKKDKKAHYRTNSNRLTDPPQQIE